MSEEISYFVSLFAFILGVAGFFKTNSIIPLFIGIVVVLGIESVLYACAFSVFTFISIPSYWYFEINKRFRVPSEIKPPLNIFLYLCSQGEKREIESVESALGKLDISWHFEEYTAPLIKQIEERGSITRSESSILKHYNGLK